MSVVLPEDLAGQKEIVLLLGWPLVKLPPPWSRRPVEGGNLSPSTSICKPLGEQVQSCTHSSPLLETWGANCTVPGPSWAGGLRQCASLYRRKLPAGVGHPYRCSEHKLQALGWGTKAGALIGDSLLWFALGASLQDLRHRQADPGAAVCLA